MPATKNEDIAIIGIGCRFPGGAHTPKEFWNLLCNGVDAITHIPEDRFDVKGVFDPDPEAPGKIYSTWGGFIDKVDKFDADFFGISPREAKRMDPQHRLLLEVTWEALEDGGVVPEQLAGTPTGVYIGISSHDYADMHVQPARRKLLDAHINIGNALSVAANRISYLLDLHGPSFAIESACSSSLTALHLACQSLQKEESTMALVGGVNLILSPELTVGFCKAGMISPDGRCRAFDARANGYVRSEGAGVVVLKPLQKAREEGDRIYAIVKGTAINEDGRTAGISLPNGAAQEEVLRQTLEKTGCDPTDIHYVEAHGTGTNAGDPAEAGALGRVYGASHSKKKPCIIGSAKTNLGHLEAAAGMVGLIKTALALRHRKIPPNLHFDTPNPEIPFEDYHLKVPTSLMNWPQDTFPARAGVNAFGFGGTNAHVVLEEAPPPQSTSNTPCTQAYLLTVSARTPHALKDYVDRYKECLLEGGKESLKDFCDAAANRKSHFKHRLAVVGNNVEELVEGLEFFQSKEKNAATIVGKAKQTSSPKVAFVFSGMGPQWFAMGRQLFATEPVYRDALTHCDQLLRPISGWSLIDELHKDEAVSRIAEAELAHVANFAVQVALVEMWKSWGVTPEVVVGHSSGEIAAAYATGALSLKDAIYLAYHRGRLQHSMAGTGGMLAAALSADLAEDLIKGQKEKVALAAVNSADSVTFSGDMEFLTQLAGQLEQEGRFCRLLQVDVPYHGPQMQEIRDELLHVLADLKPNAAQLPIVSSVSGSYLEGEAFNSEYWWQNVRNPVRFDQAIGVLLAEDIDIFLEIGPHPVLSTYLLEILGHHEKSASILPSLRRKENEKETLFRSLGHLYVQGYPVHWKGVYPEGSFFSLPSYPWQRERHWMESLPTSSSGSDTGHPLLGKRLHTASPLWETSLDDPRTDFLNDHLVDNSIVFPGAGYVEMMLSAAGETWKDAPLSLVNIKFHKLLFLEASRAHLLQCGLNLELGSLQIHGAGENNKTWTQHAEARVNVAKDGAQAEKVDLDAIRQRCNREVPVEEHFRLLETRGFNYGSAFRGIGQIQVGEGEALARIELPEGLHAEYFRVHPALLDAAFQVLVVVASHKLNGEADADPLFPVSIGRVSYQAPASGSFLAYIRVREGSDALLEGDVAIVNEASEVVVSIESLRAKLLHEARKEPTYTQKEWSYEFRWDEQSPGKATSNEDHLVRKTTEIQKLVEKTSLAPEDDLDVRIYHDLVVPELNRIAGNYALRALEKLGWDAQLHKDHKADELCVDFKIKKAYQPLFLELYRMGISQLEEENNPWQDLDKRLGKLKNRAPQYAAECELVKKGGGQLAEMLTGSADVREVLLSSSSLRLLSTMYHDSPACHNYQELLADVISHSFDKVDDQPSPKILEIGAGTGAATSEIIPRIPEGAQYVFTDISPYFLTEAKHRFGKNTEFAVLDIEKDPVSQGFRKHSFDMIVAANVLHTTRDLKSSLAHVHQLLKPGGLIVILEITRKADWFNLVFGLLDGWWRFKDSKLRKDSPLIGWRQWQEVLADCDFIDAKSLFTSKGGEESLQTITLAHAGADKATQSTATITTNGKSQPNLNDSTHLNQGSWLILADTNGVAEQVEKGLKAKGYRCVLVHPGTGYIRHDHNHYQLSPEQPEEVSRLFTESGLIDEDCKGVIHLWPLDAPPNKNISSSELLESQKSVCLPLLLLLQQQPKNLFPSLWLVTSGAQKIEEGVEIETPQLAQSPLWGLGRVVANEFEDLSCKLVDFSAQPSPSEIYGLLDLISGECEDEEIALRGERHFVRRLHRLSLEDLEPKRVVRNMNPDAEQFRLEINRPGALESLVLKEVETPPPGNSELIIRVRASGLNFQEVLLALGLLPREALPKDLDHSSLGLECAGTVLECGDGVTGFKPGDEVIALASYAHGSRARAQSHLVVHKPENLSFEQSASLINAFVTATYSLHQVAGITKEDRVLIHSATGAVGLAAIQLCREIGAEVFATAGTQKKRDYLRSIGIKYVMDSRSTSFMEEVLEHTHGEGVDVVLNSLKGKAMEASVNLLRPYGRFVELGKRDIYENSLLGLSPFQRNLTYTAVDLQQMALDRPDFANRMIRQVVQEVAQGRWEVIPTTTFDLSEAEQAFRFMAQARHIGKIVLTQNQADYSVVPKAASSGWKQEASYLITGGLGGFGLATAKWLGEKGVKSLVLMSRSGVPKDNAEILEQLADSPTEVTVIQGDVSKAEDVKRVLDYIRKKLPPLKGVIHAAMNLEDCAISNLEFKGLHKVMLPKMAGAWNLHCLTTDVALDHFILFSSVASALGHPMQGNYSAANTFMDTLSGLRRKLGLPALSIGWGAVSGVGYVSRHPEVINYLNRSGLTGFTPEDALNTMEKFLDADKEHVLIAKIDWEQWIGTHPVMASSKRFSKVYSKTAASTKKSDAEPETALESLLSASSEHLKEEMENYLARKLARISGGKTDNIDLDRPLTEMGFDSLMAVELTTALNSDLGIKLPVVKVLQGINAHELGKLLLQQLDLPTKNSKGKQHSTTSGEKEMPLSAEQARFWYLEQHSPGDPALHLVAAATLRGELNRSKLKESIQAVVNRHEILKSTYFEVNGEPIQRVEKSIQVAFEFKDLSNLPLGEREKASQRLSTDAIQKPFSLQKGPLLRTLLLQMDDQAFALLLMAHHIVADSWTIALIAKEVMREYAAKPGEDPTPFRQAALPYSTYLEKQRKALSPGLIEKQLRYWKKQLKGWSGEKLFLPPDFPPREKKRIRGSHIAFTVSEQLTAQLSKLSQQKGVTPFVTLLTAFQALLHAYSRDTDIGTATPLVKRDLQDMEGLMGCCMNTVLLRNDLSGNPSFNELLKRTRKVYLEALEHQEVPFQRVVETLNPQRKKGHSPLFSNMLIFHNIPALNLDMGGLTLNQRFVETGAAVADLALLIRDGKSLQGSLEFNVDLFDKASAELFLDHFQQTLQTVLNYPDITINKLPHLIEERGGKSPLNNPEGSTLPVAKGHFLHHLVEEQVRKNPKATAILWKGKEMSYAELNRRANYLAHLLIKQGIDGEKAIGVFLKHSPELLVALLGILKAGKAFLILDTELPLPRITHMVKDAKVKCLVSQNRHQPDFPTGEIAILDIDSAKGEEEFAPEVPQISDNASAYLVYTSGTSGSPKGIVIPHKAICNQVNWRQDAFPMDSSDAVLQRSPLSFDPCIWEFFGPLIAGARVVLPTEEMMRDTRKWAKLISEQKITHLQVTPSLLQALLEEPAFLACHTLKYIFCGGEPLTSRLVKQFFSSMGSTRLIHLYGPAEACIDSTCWVVNPDLQRSRAPIGKPIANVNVFVMDQDGRMLPKGIPGELCISGAGLASGYVNPGKHDKHFVRVKEGELRGKRLYRTGDLGRILPDGNLEFLGRMDEQVKIRGQRVEPKEVAISLLQLDDISDAYVLGTNGKSDDPQLLAYLVPKKGKYPSKGKVRKSLSRVIPEYMLPSQLIFLEKLPKIPSGKVDVQELKSNGSLSTGHKTPLSAPQTAVEERLVQLLGELLQREAPIGVEDDFFELGGHSLLAMRYISAINREYGKDFPVSLLMDKRTVKELGREINGG